MNDIEEVLQNEKTFIETTETSTVLKLFDTRLTQNGCNFSVKIQNELGEAVSNKAKLVVSSGPAFVEEPANKSTLRDKETRFECIVKSNPKPTVSWFFNDRELTVKDGVRIEKDLSKDKYSLVIPKTSDKNLGVYTVKAINEFGSSEKKCTLELLELPKVLNKLENLTVNENEPASFTVNFSGKPYPKTLWFKNDIELEVAKSVEVNETIENQVSVTIKSCKSAEHTGVYFAKVFNEFGEVATNKVTLAVNRAPKFVTKPTDSVGVQGQSIKFETLIEGQPKAKVSWFLNDKELTAKDGVKFEVDAKTNTCNLVIAKILGSHLGEYKVKAVNTVGSVEHTFKLDVLEIPKINGKLDNVSSVSGKDAKLTVKIGGGKPQPKSTWFIEDEEIKITEEFEVIDKEETASLVIKNVRLDQAGNYSVKLENEAGSVTSNKAQLIVNSLPVFVKVPMAFIPLKKDESISIEVVVEAQPKPTIKWMLNERELLAKDGVQFAKNLETNTYSLIIPKLNPLTHSGAITVLATNVVGTSKHCFNVDVLG